MRMEAAHQMSTQQVCQLNSNSCCNGLACPHSGAVCCPNGKHCCPTGAVCLPAAPGGSPRCGFPVKVSAPNYSPCNCPPPPPCTTNPCAPAPACSCTSTSLAAQNAQPAANPLAAQIERLTAQDQVRLVCSLFRPLRPACE
jgi:hypothetical protein